MGTHPIFESDFDCLTDRLSMPSKNRRRFIKPGEGKKFRLVNRSIRDLGGYVEGAGQHVLAPIGERPEDFSDEEDFNAMDADERKALQREYGVDFNDGYNYMQHLKERSDEATVWVSADNQSVFSVASHRSGMSRASRASRSSRISRASKTQGKFFETNQELPENHFQELAANRNDLPLGFDPEVAAQLDELDDSEMLVNPEEDETEDFDQMIAAANEEGSDDEAFGTGERIGDTDSNFIMERFGLGNGAEFVGHSDEGDVESDEYDENENFYPDELDDQFEKKTRFTAYSMTSSIMARSEKLQTLDDQFEEFYAKYDEDEIGDLPDKNLEDNEIELDDQMIYDMMKDDHEALIPGYKDNFANGVELAKQLNMGEDVKRYLENKVDTDEEDEKEFEYFTPKPKPKWDCETICSTYSNLYNRPKVLENDGFSTKSAKIRPNKNKKVMFGNALKELESQYQEERSEFKARPQARKKGETKEEKKARKALVKEAKRERRVEKKETRSAFAAEFRESSKRE